jgi:hypothetical protein
MPKAIDANFLRQVSDADQCDRLFADPQSGVVVLEIAVDGAGTLTLRTDAASAMRLGVRMFTMGKLANAELPGERGRQTNGPRTGGSKCPGG